MRLIDADAFIEQVKADIKEMQVPEFIMAAEAFTNDIARRPTIEAIPVEWIKDTIKLAERVQSNKYAEYLRLLLRDWKEENGK